MTYTTQAEQAQRAREIAAEEHAVFRRERMELVRACPHTQVLDDEHLYVVGRAGAGAHNQNLLDHTFRARGLVALGLDKAAVAHELALTLEALEHELTRDLYWAATADVLEPMSEVTRATYGAGPMRRA